MQHRTPGQERRALNMTEIDTTRPVYVMMRDGREQLMELDELVTPSAGQVVAVRSFGRLRPGHIVELERSPSWWKFPATRPAPSCSAPTGVRRCTCRAATHRPERTRPMAKDPYLDQLTLGELHTELVALLADGTPDDTPVLVWTRGGNLTPLRKESVGFRPSVGVYVKTTTAT
jgi:hypothetical protein